MKHIKRELIWLLENTRDNAAVQHRIATLLDWIERNPQ